MRICPKCGHEDDYWWRPRRSRVYCEYTKVDTLEWNQPELLKKIQEAQPDIYNDGHFVYHITRKGINVERIEKKLYDFMGWGAEPQEKVDHSMHPNQYFLSQFTSKDDKDVLP